MRGVGIAVFVLGVLAMAQHSMQFSLKNPNLISHKLKSDVSYFALITSAKSTEKALNESGFFTPESYVDLHGRRFVTGTIYGAPVVYVRSASTPSVHVGVTVQILLDNYNVREVIYVGAAGTTNESISLGSVVIPKDIAFTGAWDWLSKDSNEKGQLNIGDFNYPENGENLLGSIAFEDMQIYKYGEIDTYFWLHVDRELLNRYASAIEIDGGDVIVGLKGSSSDIYVNNPAYREFLYKTFRVSTVDTGSVAAGLATLSNNQRFIAFQGVSNDAGAGSGGSESALANANAIKAVVRFIWLQFVPRVPHEY